MPVASKSLLPGLESEAKILAIVYNKDKTLYKYQYFTPADAKLFLPPGREFSIVFYSYNSSIIPDINDYILGDTTDDGAGGYLFSEGAKLLKKPEDFSRNVFWAKIPNTGKISTLTKLPNILFVPIFSRMQWVLRSSKGTITQIDAEIENTYSSAMVDLPGLEASEDMYKVWAGNNPNFTPLVFPVQGKEEVVCDKQTFLVDEKKNTVLKLNKIEVNGVKAVDKKFELNILKRGTNYSVISNIVAPDEIYSVEFTTSGNGVVTPSGIQSGVIGTIVTSTASLTTENTEAALEGWYGNGVLITGTSPSANEYIAGNTLIVKLTSETNNKVYEARFVEKEGLVTVEPGVAAPRIYIVGEGDDAVMHLTQNPRTKGAYFQYGSIIAYSNTGAPEQKWNPSILGADWDKNWNLTETPRHDVRLLREGKGDPCRLLGFSQRFIKQALLEGKAPDNGVWYMPSLSDNQLIVKQGFSAPVTLSGVIGRFVGPGASLPDPKGIFFPIEGIRETSGNLLLTPWLSIYQSSTVGRNFYISDSGINGEYGYYQAGGLTVRCIRR